MKYIFKKDGKWVTDTYRNYIREVQHNFSPDAKEVASPDWYRLNGDKTLHDATIVGYEFSLSGTGAEEEFFHNLVIKFLKSNNKLVSLLYSDVTCFELKDSVGMVPMQSVSIHETYCLDDDRYNHGIVFVSGDEWKIECADIAIRSKGVK